ncbi:pentatricopeptide repeat-containing protein At3g53360, mitochondrial isoform X1 [Andrographis paniculata]|uniref:pentatricopeptide repeat-containing protein At3g53360, mitochondrial isoform X1 n=1 Tax=Andrographis paniculata TaxID=175694 RepID=UPI0021E80888|nr:pentatricopeptide repeat-containing protein At3g53360, mitochondrial isoform X1 [Andrographis paniculata]XP_051138635.1 pentatricopeptide repeat-containing protein At3g53360, mitochondrial isoform X1 [Andrographis paniculata]
MKRLQSNLKWCDGYVKRGIQSMVMCGQKFDDSLNFTIRSLCKQNLFKEALRAFDQFEKNADCVLELGTYANLFNACSLLKSFEYGKRIHSHVSKSNLLPNMILENHIINMYGKCGSTKDARKVFENMRERNVVTWTALLAGYSNRGLDIESVDLYIQMLQSGLIPDHFTLGNAIKSCASLMEDRLGVQLHVHVIKSEFGSEKIAQHALISMYAKFCRMNEARKIFYRIKSKDLVSWSSMISGLAKTGYELESLCYFKKMLFYGTYKPNDFIFGSVLSACSALDQPEYGKQIHGMSIKHGYCKDIYAGCALTDMYAKCGFLYSAKAAFDQIENPDIAAWNAMISGFAYGNHSNEAMSIFCQMRHSCSAPDNVTVRSLLCGFVSRSSLSRGRQVHAYVVKTALDLDLPVCNTVLTMYANCSDYTDAFKMFDEIRGNADLVSWNAIITMCLHQHLSSEVFALFRRMRQFEIAPDHITLTGVLVASGKVSSLETGDQIHCLAVKYGLDFDIKVANALIDMYVKCGSLERARKLFDDMENPDVFSWTSLIVGYAQFGYGGEALNLFRRMKIRGVNPNEVTFVGVLTACSHVGLVEEGMQLFKSMEHEHGVIPTREHFSCIVDLLARAGHIHDAEAFIDRMGFEPDIVMLKSLLASCRGRRSGGGGDVGKRVAEKVLRIDPTNSGAHSLICSLYASAGDWENVAMVRSWMREKGVKKVGGRSWIEIKDRIHVFSAIDGLHQERGKVFAMVEELWLQIVDADYDPLLRISHG